MPKVTTKTQDKSIFVMVPKVDRQKALTILQTAPFYDADTNKVAEKFTTSLLSKKDVDFLLKVLNIIYPKSRYSPTQLTHVNDDLIATGTMIKYSERDNKDLVARDIMACVMKEWRNVFKIFINELVENESYDSVDLHEKGHVLFNHLAGFNMYINQFKNELDKVWDLKLAKYFEADVFKNSKDKIVKMLYFEFSNIAQDMEINSKLFDNGEWVKAKKTMARSATLLKYYRLLEKFDSLSGLIKDDATRKISSQKYANLVNEFMFIYSNIIDRINGKEGDFQFCYPSNKGWPEKLDWMTYMLLLVKDIDDTMSQIMQQIREKLGHSGSGDGSGAGGKKISQDILDDYCDQSDGDKAAKDAANDGAGFDEEDEEDSSFESIGNRRSEGSNTRGKGSGAVKVEFETCDTFESFTKFLAKHCLGKKNRRMNSDVLYNSNRGKFASKVVVPRRHLIEKWMPTECHIIVDVSGSVPTDYVERVINSIVDTNSGIDLKHSHIIFCDTRVVSDEIMSARTKSVYAAGGTTIANGIRYVKEKGYCKKKTDKLFIISDMEDNLEEWVIEAERFPGIKYAIGYNVHSKEECEKVFDHTYTRESNVNSFKQKWNATFETIFITEVI